MWSGKGDISTSSTQTATLFMPVPHAYPFTSVSHSSNQPKRLVSSWCPAWLSRPWPCYNLTDDVLFGLEFETLHGGNQLDLHGNFQNGSFLPFPDFQGQCHAVAAVMRCRRYILPCGNPFSSAICLGLGLRCSDCLSSIDLLVGSAILTLILDFCIPPSVACCVGMPRGSHGSCFCDLQDL